MNDNSKSIFLSTTFWGIVIGALGHVGFFTWLSLHIGAPIPADNTTLANTVVGIIGDLFAIYGRIVATQPVHVLSPPAGQGGFATVRMMLAILAVAILFACAVAPQTPAQSVYAVQGAYASALTAAVAYKQLPSCEQPAPPKLCSNIAVVRKLQSADDAAYAALTAAQNIVRSPGAGLNVQTAIAVAQRAVAVLTSITATLEVK